MTLKHWHYNARCLSTLTFSLSMQHKLQRFIAAVLYNVVITWVSLCWLSRILSVVSRAYFSFYVSKLNVFQPRGEVRLVGGWPGLRELQARGRQGDRLRESRTRLRLQLPHLQELHRLQGRFDVSSQNSLLIFSLNFHHFIFSLAN